MSRKLKKNSPRSCANAPKAATFLDSTRMSNKATLGAPTTSSASRVTHTADGDVGAPSKTFPRLRFPAFRDAGGWKERKLGDAATFYNGRAYKQEELLEQGKYTVLRVGNFFTNNNWYFSDLDLDDTKYCDKGDLLYAWSASFGPRIWQGGKVIYHYHIWKVVEKIGTDRIFLFIVLENETERMKAGSANGLGLLHITKGTIESWESSFPSPAEQQKIAECLTTLDEVIAAQSQKLDTLKTHKKGLMQQLFPREGETLPRLRFPEFQDAPEWEEKPLGDIAAFSSGGTPSKDNSKYWNGHIPWVSASSMYDTRLSKADHYVTALAIGNGTRIAKAGALLILVRGSMLFNRVPICIAMIDVAFNQDVKALDHDTSINGSFLFYQLLASESRIPINETGIGAGKIELDDLKGLEVYMPSPSEQQAVANCLSNLDDLIAAQTQKLAALKTHKKGLMQQLFPSSGEVEQ